MMKPLLPLFTSLIALSLIVTPVFAQKEGGQRPGGKAGAGERRAPGIARERMVEIENRVLANMNLTAKQRADIRTLNDSIQRRMEAVRRNQNLTREQKMQNMRAIGKERNDGLSKILSKAQLEQYRKLMAEEMKKLRDQRKKEGGRKPGKPGGSKSAA